MSYTKRIPCPVCEESSLPGTYLDRTCSRCGGTGFLQRLLPIPAKDYPPCRICGGPNDVGEVCAECSKTNDPFGVDLEASGGWMAQDR